MAHSRSTINKGDLAILTNNRSTSTAIIIGNPGVVREKYGDDYVIDFWLKGGKGRMISQTVQRTEITNYEEAGSMGIANPMCWPNVYVGSWQDGIVLGGFALGSRPTVTSSLGSVLPPMMAYETSPITVEKLKEAYQQLQNQETVPLPKKEGNYLQKTMKKSKDESTEIEPKITANPHEILGQDKVKGYLRVAVEMNIPALLVGDTGTGKTSIIKGLADEQDKKYVRYNLTGETTVDEFLGKYTLRNEETVWEDGVLLRAMKEGKWLIVDEINVALPEILFVLHSLLDDERAVLVANHQGEIVKPHEDFRFFATMNPVDEYAGTKDLNKAFKSRFSMIIEMSYPTSSIESKVIQSKTGVAEADAKFMVDLGSAIRDAKSQGKVFYTCSTRDLLQWGSLIAELGIGESFQLAILSKANGDGEFIKKIYKDLGGLYNDLERQGAELNIEWFTKEFGKLEKERQELKSNKDKIKKDLMTQIAKDLGINIPKEVLEGN